MTVTKKTIAFVLGTSAYNAVENWKHCLGHEDAYTVAAAVYAAYTAALHGPKRIDGLPCKLWRIIETDDMDENVECPNWQDRGIIPLWVIVNERMSVDDLRGFYAYKWWSDAAEAMAALPDGHNRIHPVVKKTISGWLAEEVR